jgi:hypothetical protein
MLTSLMAIALMAIPAAAATISVTNTSDAGAGSFRDAVATAAPGDNITFAVSGTIVLTSGKVTISTNLTITGPGATSLIISGGNSSGVLCVAVNTTVSISGVKITGGNTTGTGNAGGITNNGNLTMTDCEISGNTAANCAGGIYSPGTPLRLVNCTVAENTASGSSMGGGVSIFGSTGTFLNCTIANNTASGGGGLYIFNSSSSATVTIVNCTIAGNTALSGVQGGGGINVNTSTTGAVWLLNTIVASNTATVGPDVKGTIISLGHNLIGKTNNSIGFGENDQTGTTASPLNPMINVLGIYGDYPVRMRPLLGGSPATDAGDGNVLNPPYSLTTDQRGASRPYAAGVDIGAYESLGDVHLPVELTGFDAAVQDRQVYVSWRTASEVRNAGFELQRAGSDSVFMPIASYLTDPNLLGLGSSSQGKNYNYTDGNDGSLEPGKTYLYRLVDVATDGTRTEHPSLAVRIESLDGVRLASMRLYPASPNPSVSTLTLRFSLPEPTQVTIEFYGADGHRIGVPVQAKEYAAGEHAESVNVDQLPAGSYTMMLTAGREIRTGRFTVVR